MDKGWWSGYHGNDIWTKLNQNNPLALPNAMGLLVWPSLACNSTLVSTLSLTWDLVTLLPAHCSSFRGEGGSSAISPSISRGNRLVIPITGTGFTGNNFFRFKTENVLLVSQLWGDCGSPGSRMLLGVLGRL